MSAETPEQPRRSAAIPLAAFALVAVFVIGVVAFNLFEPKKRLTVESLQAPAVAALGGGSDVYPANSRRAVEEVVKFGYLPAVDLTALADGTVVLGSESDAEAVFGKPLAELTLDEFSSAEIPSPREGGPSSDPITWEDAFGDFGDATVFVPLIDDAEVLSVVLDTVKEADSLDALIVRTEDPAVAAAAKSAGAAAMFTGDVAAEEPAALAEEGFTAVAVPADGEFDTWANSDLAVWVTGVETPEALYELAGDGIAGALAANPYLIQPSAVKTD